MARIKLTKSAVDAAKPQAQAIELRDTVVPGFLCKITPAGRKVFMLQYRTNAGERRKPALGQYGELTVEQARVMAQTVFDVVAIPAETPLIVRARAQGKRVITGLEVIAIQALEQFVLYTGVRPTQEQFESAVAFARG